MARSAPSWGACRPVDSAGLPKKAGLSRGGPSRRRGRLTDRSGCDIVAELSTSLRIGDAELSTT
jgi:hypothetical protein